ncbi:MAG: MBL fold metallo-hydrolase [Elusimicrobiota bacterium]
MNTEFKIYFLGTGSARATASRDNTSLYLEWNSANVLIDCPGSIVHKFEKLELDFKNIDRVIITHLHPDHVYGLPSLLHTLKPHGTFPDILVPPGTSDKFDNFLKLFRLNNLDIKILEIKNNKNLIPHLKFFSTRHTPESRGIIIDKENFKFVYTADTGPMDNYRSVFKNAGYLIHDCYAPVRLKDKISALDKHHTSAGSLGEMAEKSKVKNLVPIHFSGEYREEFKTEELIQELKKYYSGNIIIPEDLTSLAV